ncbi:MAG TPA: cytochrome P450 [Polyangiaceae bacterium]|jgi:cytochrome P450
MTTASVLTSDFVRPPPRVPGELLLGNLRDFRRDRPAMQLRVAREHPHLASMRLGIFDVLLASSPAVAHEVLQAQADGFVKSLGLSLFMRPVLGNGLLTSEHETHTRQRRLIAPALTPKRIAAYAATMAERAARTVAGWRDGQAIDAADEMMRLTLEIVGKTLLDAEIREDATEVGEALTEVMRNTVETIGSVIPFPPAVPTPKNLATRRAKRHLDALIYRLIAERRRDPGDRADLLSLLLAARDEDGSRMDDEQVRDEAMTLFLAGHETTAAALAWAIHLLALNPEARARAEEETAPFAKRGTPLTLEDLRALPYTLAVLKETMRLYPPAYILGRRAQRDVRIPGAVPDEHHVVRKGTTVLVNVLGIHHRPDLFPDPERFDPTRFLGDKEKELPRCAYMPFGAGPRICVGNHFALMEGHLLLATIVGAVRLDHLPGKETVGTEPLVTLRPRGGVHVRVKRRED